MYVLQGNFRESPQETHWWNNRWLTQDERLSLNLQLMLWADGDPAACKPWVLGIIPRFHMPIVGGWRKFGVIRPQLLFGEKWYVGWMTEDGGAGVSLLPLHSNVRLLLGPQRVRFFGLNEEGRQIRVVQEDGGLIGQAGKHAQLPLR